MAGIRMEKVARLIQREMGEIFLGNQRAWLPGKMITVTQVRMSPDLSFAKVYVSIFPSASAKEDLESLREQTGALRLELGKRIRNQLRGVPEIALYLDDSLDYAERIDELLR